MPTCVRRLILAFSSRSCPLVTYQSITNSTLGAGSPRLVTGPFLGPQTQTKSLSCHLATKPRRCPQARNSRTLVTTFLVGSEVQPKHPVISVILQSASDLTTALPGEPHTPTMLHYDCIGHRAYSFPRATRCPIAKRSRQNCHNRA
jgi:hypothetical protein